MKFYAQLLLLGGAEVSWNNFNLDYVRFRIWKALIILVHYVGISLIKSVAKYRNRIPRMEWNSSIIRFPIIVILIYS